MIPALIANPLSKAHVREKPYAIPRPKPEEDTPANEYLLIEERVRTATSPTLNSEESYYNEDSYIFRLLILMLVALVLPGLLGMVYLILNPDAFMYDITPNRDFSSWYPGKAL